jgi:hypothetical protein
VLSSLIPSSSALTHFVRPTHRSATISPRTTQELLPEPKIYLNCLVLGDGPNNVFPVEISASVGKLKDAIKDKKRPAWDSIIADSLVLWKVSISFDEFEAKLANAQNPEDVPGSEKLKPVDALSEHFLPLELKRIHIIVERPVGEQFTPVLFPFLKTFVHSTLLLDPSRTSAGEYITLFLFAWAVLTTARLFFFTPYSSFSSWLWFGCLLLSFHYLSRHLIPACLLLTVVLPRFPHLWPCVNLFLLSFGFMLSIQTHLSPLNPKTSSETFSSTPLFA